MEKIKLAELKLNVYKVKGEKDGKELNFFAYEMALPNNASVNMSVSQKNTEITKINLYKYLGKIDKE